MHVLGCAKPVGRARMRSRLSRIALASFIASAALTARAEAECVRTRFFYGPAIANYPIQLQAEKNGVCEITIGEYGTRLQLVDELRGISVVKRPSHGQAGGFSSDKFAYKPFANYSGRDEFSVLVKFVAHGVSGATRLDFSVDVSGR
jgi:hypothetical protein